MPDLWKALGDVYGDTSPDAPPVKVEPAAEQRTVTLPLDDDLAAALSAALVNAPAGPAPVAAPAPTPVPVAPPAPVVPPVPVAFVPPVVVPEPVVPAAQDKVASWLAEIETRQELRDKGPDLEAALPEGPTWARADDDIVPSKGKGKAGRKARKG